MAVAGKAFLDSREAQRQEYVDEFRALWDRIGGADFAAKATCQELIEKATQQGATERQIAGILRMQETFKGIEDEAERVQNDPIYAAKMERQADEFERLVDRAKQPKNSFSYKFRRFLGGLFR